MECVDYCLGVLIFENVRKLKKIVKELVKERVDDVEGRKKLVSQFEAVNDFLKHGYCRHIDTDGDCAQNSRRALVRHSTGTAMASSSSGTGLSSNCDECLKPFQCVENVREAVLQEEYVLKEVLDNASLNIKLFMGHAI